MKYVAFLRGINVGGNKTVKMSELKTLLEKIGYEHVQTLLNSGNVVFETGQGSKEKITKHLEAECEKRFGWHIAVMVRSIDDMKKILDKNPYKKDTEFKTYISFLSEEPDKDLIKTFLSLQTADEGFSIQGREVYALLKGMGASKVFILLEKKLKVLATNRNTNTLEKIVTL
jgi:uncharacterized protein (DUF1697 family)